MCPNKRHDDDIEPDELLRNLFGEGRIGKKSEYRHFACDCVKGKHSRSRYSERTVSLCLPMHTRASHSRRQGGTYNDRTHIQWLSQHTIANSQFKILVHNFSLASLDFYCVLTLSFIRRQCRHSMFSFGMIFFFHLVLARLLNVASKRGELIEFYFLNFVCISANNYRTHLIRHSHT